MERKPNSINKISQVRRIPYWITKKLIEKAMKKQFDNKRRNPQRLKAGYNIWLEAKNIHLNRPSKKLNQKRYRPFKIFKNIRQGVFQLELPKGWMIHDVFNKDLLTRCREPAFSRTTHKTSTSTRYF